MRRHIQNDEGRLLPTDPEVIKKRAKKEEIIKDWLKKAKEELSRNIYERAYNRSNRRIFIPSSRAVNLISNYMGNGLILANRHIPHLAKERFCPGLGYTAYFLRI